MLGYKIIAIIEIKHLTLFLIFISLSSVLSKVCHPNNKNLPLGKFHVIHYHIDTGLHQDFHHIHIYNKYLLLPAFHRIFSHPDIPYHMFYHRKHDVAPHPA